MKNTQTSYKIEWISIANVCAKRAQTKNKQKCQRNNQNWSKQAISKGSFCVVWVCVNYCVAMDFAKKFHLISEQHFKSQSTLPTHYTNKCKVRHAKKENSTELIGCVKVNRMILINSTKLFNTPELIPTCLHFQAQSH